MQSLYSTDWDIFADPFLSSNRFSFQMSGFANLVKTWIFSRQIPINQNLYLELKAIVVFHRLGYFSRQNMNIFPSDSHKPKSLPGNIFRWVQIQNFFLMLNVRNPPNFDNLGDDQKTGISTDLRPAFFHEFWKKWVGMSTLWSRNQDCWSLLFTKTSLQYFTFVYLSSFGVFLVSGRNLD